MFLNKAQRKMVWSVAGGVKQEHPYWSDHSCLEHALIKCAGLSGYVAPLESMLQEFYNKPLPIKTNQNEKQRGGAGNDWRRIR